MWSRHSSPRSFRRRQPPPLRRSRAPTGRGALERHVLEQVRDAVLLTRLRTRPGADPKAEGTLSRWGMCCVTTAIPLPAAVTSDRHQPTATRDRGDIVEQRSLETPPDRRRPPRCLLPRCGSRRRPSGQVRTLAACGSRRPSAKLRRVRGLASDTIGVVVPDNVTHSHADRGVRIGEDPVSRQDAAIVAAIWPRPTSRRTRSVADRRASRALSMAYRRRIPELRHQPPHADAIAAHRLRRAARLEVRRDLDVHGWRGGGVDATHLVAAGS